MPQKMNVVCCCSCQIYQVHIVKKAKKWECKVCGEKQSFIKVFFEGSGKDCRLAVHNLNSVKSKEQPPMPECDSHDYFSDTNEEFSNESDLISSSQDFETDFFYSNPSKLDEFLENEPQEEDNDLNKNKPFSFSLLNSSDDKEIENCKSERGNEENEQIWENYKFGKRYNDDEDFSVPRKKFKTETSFADLIEESDSDNPDETEMLESKESRSIFESNCDIDFSLDF